MNRFGRKLLLRTRHSLAYYKQVRPGFTATRSKVIGVGYRLLSACGSPNLKPSSVSSTKGEFGKRKYALVTALVLCLASINIIVAILQQQRQCYRMKNTGIIKSINCVVYWERDCLTVVTDIDWGTLDPNTSKNRLLYIRNEGSGNITLQLTTENWIPDNCTYYITLTWNYGNQVIVPDEVILITFTLTISANITGINNFTFDIIISGVE